MEKAFRILAIRCIACVGVSESGFRGQGLGFIGLGLSFGFRVWDVGLRVKGGGAGLRV